MKWNPLQLLTPPTANNTAGQRKNMPVQVLICTRENEGTVPLKIKVQHPGSLSYIGFYSKELGDYYLKKRGVDASRYDFIDLESFFASTTIQEREGTMKVLYLHTEDIVDRLTSAPASFAYDEYNLLPGEILKRGLIRNPPSTK